jgi:hypothetical protein
MAQIRSAQLAMKIGGPSAGGARTYFGAACASLGGPAAMTKSLHENVTQPARGRRSSASEILPGTECLTGARRSQQFDRTSVSAPDTGTAASSGSGAQQHEDAMMRPDMWQKYCAHGDATDGSATSRAAIKAKTRRKGMRIAYIQTFSTPEERSARLL